MTELDWKLLKEVYGRQEAELIQSYLNAYGIQVELFQEAVGHLAYPTTIDGLAKVQIYIKKSDLPTAQELLSQMNESGMDDGINNLDIDPK